MVCKACESGNLKSVVSSHGGSVTCLGWSPHWDPNGVKHSHNPNRITMTYSCSNGHTWSENKYYRCPADGCSYGKVPA